MISRAERKSDLHLTAGVTLLELMFAVALMTVVMGMLFVMATGLGDTAQVQAVKTATSDEVRKAMIYIARDIRQATKGSVSALPAATLNYRIAADLDGNGTAVDVGGNLETSVLRTIERDTGDANHDGVTGTQVILRFGGTAMVLANEVLQNEDLDNDGLLDPGEDTNSNGRLDRGIWFERDGNAVRVTIQTQGVSRRGHHLVSTFTETVLPRN